jgi:BirA family biotin operon repressor/biotin-[acetyl-CoA-carboxylase] ligase
VLRLSLPLSMSHRVNFWAAVAVVELLRDFYGVEAQVKWPNDVLVEDRKICGILSEIEAEGERLTFLNVGLGINLNNRPSEFEATAISLQQIVGKPVSRKAFLQRFLDVFERGLERGELDRVLPKWRRCSATLNRQVRVVTTREVFEGRAVDVDEDGALILRSADGTLNKIIYGDCFFDRGAGEASAMPA